MTNKELQKAFLEHGNNFHFKVVRKLRSLDWDTAVSPYYSDYATDKTREVDLYSEKFFEISDMGQFDGHIKVKIFGECKYTPDHNKIGLWFDDPSQYKLIKYMENKLDFNEHSVRDIFNGEDNSNENHHLNIGEVVKLFGSSSEPNYSNEDLYKAVNQVLSSLVFFRPANRVISSEKNGRIRRKYNLPVIFTNNFDNLYRVEDESIEPVDSNKSFVTLETNYAYVQEASKETEYFLIDLVNFNHIEDYVSKLNSDAKDYANRYSHGHAK